MRRVFEASTEAVEILAVRSGFGAVDGKPGCGSLPRRPGGSAENTEISASESVNPMAFARIAPGISYRFAGSGTTHARRTDRQPGGNGRPRRQRTLLTAAC